MDRLMVNFNEELGSVKPMHAVNNGPVYKVGASQQVTNIESYKAAGIPYQRNHDASFLSTYGGNHTVDVAFIFTDFDADPYDPASYDFACTDQYMKVCELAGVKTFYRLGSRIEHEIKKYNTLPPKDFHKWAVICEHIIKHYCYGWADGFHYDIEYWEIWNEPDLQADDDPPEAKLNWGGTGEEFFELFNITLKHLKSKFPELKIGGPAIAGLHPDWNDNWAEKFIQALDMAPDFLSWHCYTDKISDVVRKTNYARELLDKYEMYDTESILNEWNCVREWSGEGFIRTIKNIMGLKGAAFTAAVMLSCQNLPLDMLMYYDARPCGFNGLWAPYTYELLKGYYPFYAFNILYRLGTNVKAESMSENVYLAAAKNDTEAAIMITHYDDDDNSEGREVTLNLKGFDGKVMEYYLLDETHDLEKIEEKAYTERDSISLSHNATMLIKIK